MTPEPEAAVVPTQPEAPVVSALSPADTLLVGRVFEEYRSPDSNRAMIRWRTCDGQVHERILMVLKGIWVSAGDLVLLQRPSNWPEWMVTQVVESLDEARLPPPQEIRVDRNRVEIDAADEIVLRCGKASITLRSDGRLILRGAYVETRASGVNRIKGGAVLIN